MRGALAPVPPRTPDKDERYAHSGWPGRRAYAACHSRHRGGHRERETREFL